MDIKTEHALIIIASRCAIKDDNRIEADETVRVLCGLSKTDDAAAYREYAKRYLLARVDGLRGVADDKLYRALRGAGHNAIPGIIAEWVGQEKDRLGFDDSMTIDEAPKPAPGVRPMGLARRLVMA